MDDSPPGSPSNPNQGQFIQYLLPSVPRYQAARLRLRDLPSFHFKFTVQTQFFFSQHTADLPCYS
jgi:hypothetical protein